MTAKTSQHLADTLRAAGFEDLAVRAEADEFHDFLSQRRDLPGDLALDCELYKRANDDTQPQHQRIAAHHIRARHHDGEFDASKEESDEWAESEDGKAAHSALLRAFTETADAGSG